MNTVNVVLVANRSGIRLCSSVSLLFLNSLPCFRTKDKAKMLSLSLETISASMSLDAKPPFLQIINNVSMVNFHDFKRNPRQLRLGAFN